MRSPPLTQLVDLGWSSFFADQVDAKEATLRPVRIAAVHRGRLSGITPSGISELVLPAHGAAGDYAVGDWALLDPQSSQLHRRLERLTVLERYSSEGASQIAASNVDTLLIVTSCNADFNSARLERYLAFANQANVRPVIVLTKGDTADDAGAFVAHARELQRELPVVVVDPRNVEAANALATWTGAGQTVAQLGSSGVGKSTLVNTLAGNAEASPQQTGDIREQDAKGRHTTTSRSLHRIADGGWIIDMPGIRSLHMSEIVNGLDVVFAEVAELTADCRFRDCEHIHEPGCAVLAALADHRINPQRVERWRKLRHESIAGAKPGPTARSARRRR